MTISKIGIVTGFMLCSAVFAEHTINEAVRTSADASALPHLSIRAGERYLDTKKLLDEIPNYDLKLKFYNGVMACFSDKAVGLNPWNCKPDGTLVNVYQECLKVLREKMQSDKNHQVQVESGATTTWKKVSEYGIENLPLVAYKYRLTKVGNDAVSKLIVLLLESGNLYLAHLYFLGWLSDQPKDSLCDKNKAHLLRIGSALLKSFTNTALENRKDELNNCSETLTDLKTRETVSLQAAISTPNFPLNSGNSTIPNWYEVSQDPEQKNMASQLRLALSYSGEDVKYFEDLANKNNADSKLTPCEHLDPKVAFHQAARFTSVDSTKVKALTAHYPKQIEILRKEFVANLFEEVLTNSDNGKGIDTLFSLVEFPEIFELIDKIPEKETDKLMAAAAFFRKLNTTRIDKFATSWLEYIKAKKPSDKLTEVLLSGMSKNSYRFSRFDPDSNRKIFATFLENKNETFVCYAIRAFTKDIRIRTSDVKVIDKIFELLESKSNAIQKCAIVGLSDQINGVGARKETVIPETRQNAVAKHLVSEDDELSNSAFNLLQKSMGSNSTIIIKELAAVLDTNPCNAKSQRALKLLVHPFFSLKQSEDIKLDSYPHRFDFACAGLWAAVIEKAGNSNPKVIDDLFKILRTDRGSIYTSAVLALMKSSSTDKERINNQLKETLGELVLEKPPIEKEFRLKLFASIANHLSQDPKNTPVLRNIYDELFNGNHDELLRQLFSKDLEWQSSDEENKKHKYLGLSALNKIGAWDKLEILASKDKINDGGFIGLFLDWLAFESKEAGHSNISDQIFSYRFLPEILRNKLLSSISNWEFYVGLICENYPSGYSKIVSLLSEDKTVGQENAIKILTELNNDLAFKAIAEGAIESGNEKASSIAVDIVLTYEPHMMKYVLNRIFDPKITANAQKTYIALLKKYDRFNQEDNDLFNQLNWKQFVNYYEKQKQDQKLNPKITTITAELDKFINIDRFKVAKQ